MDRQNASNRASNGVASDKKYTLNCRAGTAAAITAVLFLASCAVEPPKETVSQAELAVNKATETKASQMAPLDLRKARDHLGQAKQAMQNKDYDKARRLAESAVVEAELAEAKTDAETAQTAVAELQQSLKTLREEATPK